MFCSVVSTLFSIVKQYFIKLNHSKIYSFFINELSLFTAVARTEWVKTFY